MRWLGIGILAALLLSGLGCDDLRSSLPETHEEILQERLDSYNRLAALLAPIKTREDALAVHAKLVPVLDRVEEVTRYQFEMSPPPPEERARLESKFGADQATATLKLRMEILRLQLAAVRGLEDVAPRILKLVP